MGNASGAAGRGGWAGTRARAATGRLVGAATVLVVVLAGGAAAVGPGAPTVAARPSAADGAAGRPAAVTSVAGAGTAATTASTPTVTEPVGPATTVSQGDDEGGEDPGEPMPALVQLTAGIGSAGVTIGTRCLGLAFEDDVVGCPPALRPDLTLHLESLLLPGL